MERKRLTIGLKGVNTSLNDLAVPDGACEDISNLRFHNGEWVAMGNLTTYTKGAFEKMSRLPRVLHIHEVDDSKNAITWQGVKVLTNSSMDTINIGYYPNSSGTFTSLVQVSKAMVSTDVPQSLDVKVTSYGNALFIDYQYEGEKKQNIFVWKDGKYEEFIIPAPVTITEDVESSTPAKPTKVASNTVALWSLLDEGKNIIWPTSNNKGEWWGELCYVAAYRMKDGSLLAPSALGILCSEVKDDYPLYAGKGEGVYGFITLPSDGQTLPNDVTSDKLRHFLPKLTISIPSGINTTLIDSVALFATRVNPIYDNDKLCEVVDSIDGNSVANQLQHSNFYADNNLPNQPFYLVEEIKIGGTTSVGVTLHWEKLKNLTTQPITYKPIQAHSMVGAVNYDYNSRLHMGDITTTLMRPTIPSLSVLVRANEAENSQMGLLFSLSNGSSVRADITNPNLVATLGSPQNRITLPSPIISYPDYRATSARVEVVYTDTTTKDFVRSFSMRPATANNFAYYIVPSTSEEKYPKIIEGGSNVIFVGGGTLTELTPEKPTFEERNRIQATEVNNPFSFPFENSYNVGNEDSHILGLNTIADQQPDSTFYGVFPLYIFTSDGIFALRAGQGEILYAGSEFVNHDILTNPTTISMNGSVVYVTKEGIKAISERTAVVISADVNSIQGNALDWRKAQFSVNWEFNELWVLLDGKVYIYSSPNNVWYSRTLPLLQNDTLVYTNTLRDTIYLGYSRSTISGDKVEVSYYYTYFDVNTQTSPASAAPPPPISFKTRPVKLESVNAFKKINALVARFMHQSGGQQYTLTIEGSNDLRSWRVLRSVSGTATHSVGIMRFPQSTRYIRISFTSNIRSFTTFNGVDIEFTERYGRQLR
jgi:hypothetical protein